MHTPWKLASDRLTHVGSIFESSGPCRALSLGLGPHRSSWWTYETSRLGVRTRYEQFDTRLAHAVGSCRRPIHLA